MKKCNNLLCKNNDNGFCNKSNDSQIKTTYDTLSESQWIMMRKYMEKRKKNGLKPKKECKNMICINNIDGGCYLPSEIEILSVIL